MIRPSIQDKVKVSSGWKPLITRFPFDQNSGTAIKYSDRVKSGVTGEQIWLQINEPTPNDKGKYVMELFDGKTGHQKMVDLSGQGKRVLCRLEPKVEIAVAVVQLLSCAQLFVTPWTAVCLASLSFTTSQSLLKLLSIESVMPSNHVILCHPLLLLPSVFTSIRVFSNESALCIKWLKHWSFSFSIRTSSEYSGLLSFKIDWFDLLAVQGSLKSLLQHHNSKASTVKDVGFFFKRMEASCTL